MKHRQSPSGFTLIELLCALAVAAIVLSLAVPAFGRIMARNRLATTTNELLAALLTARTLAITRNVSVLFCAGNADTGCHGRWGDREWIVFADTDRNSRLGPGESLHLAGTLTGADNIRLAGNGPFRKLVVFRPSGLARTAKGAFAAGRLRICAAEPLEANANDLVLIGSGRAVTESHDFAGRCPAP